MTIHNDIEKFIGLKPAAYRFLKSISLYRDISREGCTDYNIDLVLGRFFEGGGAGYLQLCCKGVTEINIGKLEGMFGLLLNIEDVKNRQMEGVGFRISEQENDSFSFYCSDFYVSLIS